MLGKNDIRWVKDQKNMLDVAKSHITNQKYSVALSWQQMVEYFVIKQNDHQI